MMTKEQIKDAVAEYVDTHYPSNKYSNFTRAVAGGGQMTLAEKLREIDALYAKATKGPWGMYQTARPRHFEIGPSQRCIAAMMTNDGTEDNEFGEDNARFLQALVNAWPEIRTALEATQPPTRGDKSFPELVRDAKKDVASWTQERRDNVQLEGGDK